MNAIEMLKSAIAERACDDDTFLQYAFWIRKIYHHLKIPASQWTTADMNKGFDNLGLLPHNMRYEIRTTKQTIWKMDSLENGCVCTIGQNALGLPVRLRNREKHNDAKPCEWQIARMRKGTVRSIVEARREEYARVSCLGLHEAKMPKQEAKKLPFVGRAWNKDLCALDKRFSGVSGLHRVATKLKTFFGQNQCSRQLRAEKCSLGNPKDAAKQQAEQQPIRVSRKETIRKSVDKGAWFNTGNDLQENKKRITFGKSSFLNLTQFYFIYLPARESKRAGIFYAHTTKRGESPMDFGRNLRQFQMPPQISFEN